MIDVNNFFSRSRLWTATSLLDFTPLTKAQREHLGKVYATLAICSVLTFCGASIPLQYMYFNPVFVALCCMASMAYIFFTPQRLQSSNEVTSNKRLAAMVVMSLSQGLLMRDMVHFMMYINPEIITTALFAAVAIFTCFSLGSLFMSSRTALYLGGLGLSLSIYVSMVRLTNMFFGSPFVRDFTDVAMLLSFCGFVIFDTQVTLKDFSNGSRDFVLHAVMLYGDIINIFLKIVFILYEKEKKKDKKTESRRRF